MKFNTEKYADLNNTLLNSDEYSFKVAYIEDFLAEQATGVEAYAQTEN